MAVTVIGNRQISEGIETVLLPVLNGRVPGLFVTERGIMGFGVSTNIYYTMPGITAFGGIKVNL
jgi:hypothetical protein